MVDCAKGAKGTIPIDYLFQSRQTKGNIVSICRNFVYKTLANRFESPSDTRRPFDFTVLLYFFARRVSARPL